MKNHIKIERVKLDMTQEQLAKALLVSRQTVHSIERAKFIPSTVLALKFAKFFNIKVEDIFQLEDDD